MVYRIHYVNIFNLLTDTITAAQDMWFIGDVFLREAFNTFISMRNQAAIQKKQPPYIFKYYNVFGYFQSKNSMVCGITRVLNAAVEGLNARIKLPRFMVIVQDTDIITFAQYHETEHSINEAMETMEKLLDWLLKQLEINIECRKTDLFYKKPGALVDLTGVPKIVWVHMLKQPSSKTEFSHIISLQGKFNNILEDLLGRATSKLSNFILSIEVDQKEFDISGNLLETGKKYFWRELDSCLKKFDHHEINLKPRPPKARKKDIKRKLLTPPRNNRKSDKYHYYADNYRRR